MVKNKKNTSCRVHRYIRLILLITAIHCFIADKKLLMQCFIVLIFLNEIIKRYRKDQYKRMGRKEYLDYINSDIKHVDTLNGIEFERYLKAHFIKKGYKVYLTPPQGDYGVDLVLEKHGERTAVQAKRYNHEQGYKVNYKAVQEVAAGKAIYKCTKGIVITNSFFTESAKDLAKYNNIELWDRKELIRQFKSLYSPHLHMYKDGHYNLSDNIIQRKAVNE